MGDAVDLTVLGLAPQLPDEFGALSQTGRAERVALGEQPPRGVGDHLAAIGVVAVPDELLGAPLRRQAKRLVGQKFVGCEAIMQLDNPDIFRPRRRPAR